MRSRTSSLALLAISMLLCVSMLIGTTYAWFTDSVSSGNNKILSGNLDVDLLHKVGDDYERVEGSDTLFGVELWEPGVVAYETFRVTNEGTLALKYFLSVAASNVNTVMEGGVDTGRSLLDVLKVAVVKGEIDPVDRDAALEETFASITDFGGKTGRLKPNGAEEEVEGFTESDTFTVIVWWEPSAQDNDYNLMGGAYASDADEETVGKLNIDLTVNLVATQVPYEEDAFGDDYDKDATFPRLATGPVLDVALSDAINAFGGDERTSKYYVKSITFADYDETYGAWEDGIHVGATMDDDIRMFVRDNPGGNKWVDVYYCVTPGLKILLNEDCSNLFNDFQGLVSVDFGPEGLVSTENVTNMSYMFYKCSSLTSLDLSGWDVSKVTTMAHMFQTCSKLEEIDLTGWDVSKVTDLSSLFKDCTVLSAVDLSGWDVSGVTSLSQMFMQCRSLTALDLSGWDVSRVQITNYMFSGCESLTELDLSDWNVARLTKVVEMFKGCSALGAIYSGDWDTSKFTADTNMFLDCTSLPNYNEANVSGAYAKTVANGGYFSAK